MTYLYTAFGVLVLGVTIVDLLWTTLWVEGGAGPFTARLMSGAWTAFRRVGGRDSRFLTLSGPLILVVSLTTWLVLLWVGWTLVFAGVESALIDTRNPGAVSWAERFYFRGTRCSRSGTGDSPRKAASGRSLPSS